MVVAIILSGGTGKRTGLDVPKQYFKIKDRMLIDYSLEAIAKCDDIDYFCVVAPNCFQLCWLDWASTLVLALSPDT